VISALLVNALAKRGRCETNRYRRGV